jgi:hypothetical protein
MTMKRTHRPPERFWPYVDKPEEPTAAELAAIDPELRNTLFGSSDLPFSVTLVFPPFDGPDFEKALAKARASAEFFETGEGVNRRYRARFLSSDVVRLKDLYELVGPVQGVEALIDDRRIPFWRELWLPLFWFLLLD